MVRVFLERLEKPDARAGAILDGFPRTRVQAVALDRALHEAGRRVDRAIFIEVETEDLSRFTGELVVRDDPTVALETRLTRAAAAPPTPR